jgi:hypothetical protein
MRKQVIAVPAAKPRNKVLQAIIRGAMRISTRRHAHGPRRPQTALLRDLDERVRASGEW